MVPAPASLQGTNVKITAFDIAERFIGTKEIPGQKDNPMILSMLKLDGEWPEHDEVPWCSAFVNYVAWLLRLPRSKSLAARSWLRVGVAIDPSLADIGFDVVILNRGGSPDPNDPGPGHVGFYAGSGQGSVYVLGGNQSDSVGVASYSAARMLGIRRLRSMDSL